ncbi:PEP-CTERM sorting domain-containing protein [Congregibacter variabilis]|uniref:PEP-CTERM sorting domain-containing protein n=1 Tax=Congregibacter variabilis TaxID=3081200 RepID=A0ABZ0HY21_9GAMM|nr:PEP-CTERM sorting domain-containing protein [Congregibacter sp. IMCC43200]
MSIYKVLQGCALALAVFLGSISWAQAGVITLNEGDTFSQYFSAASVRSDIAGLDVFISGVTQFLPGFGSAIFTNALFDGSTVLGETTSSVYFSRVFSADGSFGGVRGGAVGDLSTLAGINGRYDISVVTGGLSFDTNNVDVRFLLSGGGTLSPGASEGDFIISRNSDEPTDVPAPATLALFGLGLAGLGWSRRKKA